MTAIKNIGEVMHLVTHTYTVQTFASAVTLLTNYHFRTIGSRQHTHTLCLLKNTDLQCSNLCKRIFFKKSGRISTLFIFFQLSFCITTKLLPLHLDRSVGASFAGFVHGVWSVKLC